MRRDRLLEELEELYRRRGTAFVRVARGITGDADDAAEAVQEGFASAIRSRRTFRGDGPLEAWVWRVVVNAARKAVRPDENELIADAAADAAPPDVVAELAPLVASLPEQQRLAVFLRYYADLDYRSIAAVLGVERGTVGPTLAAAHRTIRRNLEEVLTDG
jgi:RNA polymerase sigma-70 factor (ECF subfamily)